MANLKEIRSRIQSTKNTQQITRAMKMVSAAKLKKAQDNIQNSRPYAKKVLSVISDIATTQRVEHPLLQPRDDAKSVLVVVITSDRGLCGAFNAGVSKFTHQYYMDNKEKYEKMDFLFVGTKGQDFMKRRHEDLSVVDTVLNLAKEISYDMAASLAKRLIAQFEEGEYDEIRLVYNEFKSAISQIVVSERLFPVDLSENSFDSQEGEQEYAKDFIFEPAPEEMIEDLLKKHFTIQVYRCLSESVASEHGARMSAMENATNNAGDRIRSLTLTYNNLRQASITTELIEITSGAEALNG